jgi:hypothetical protein
MAAAQSCGYRGEGPPLRDSDQTGDWGSVSTLMAREGAMPDGCTYARFRYAGARATANRRPLPHQRADGAVVG